VGWLLVAGWCLASAAPDHQLCGGRWAGDWHEHFERARFFLEQWPADYRFIDTYVLPARPPLANSRDGAVLALGPTTMQRYQVITCLLATLTCFPLQAICRMFGGGARAAALLAPVLMLSPLFVQNVTFPWTKLPAAFFVLAAAPLLVRNLREPTGHWHLGLPQRCLPRPSSPTTRRPYGPWPSARAGLFPAGVPARSSAPPATSPVPA